MRSNPGTTKRVESNLWSLRRSVCPRLGVFCAGVFVRSAIDQPTCPGRAGPSLIEPVLTRRAAAERGRRLPGRVRPSRSPRPRWVIKALPGRAHRRTHRRGFSTARPRHAVALRIAGNPRNQRKESARPNDQPIFTLLHRHRHDRVGRFRTAVSPLGTVSPRLRDGRLIAHGGRPPGAG